MLHLGCNIEFSICGLAGRPESRGQYLERNYDDVVSQQFADAYGYGTATYDNNNVAPQNPVSVVAVDSMVGLCPRSGWSCCYEDDRLFVALLSRIARESLCRATSLVGRLLTRKDY